MMASALISLVSFFLFLKKTIEIQMGKEIISSRGLALTSTHHLHLWESKSNNCAGNGISISMFILGIKNSI